MMGKARGEEGDDEEERKNKEASYFCSHAVAVLRACSVLRSSSRVSRIACLCPPLEGAPASLLYSDSCDCNLLVA